MDIAALLANYLSLKSTNTQRSYQAVITDWLAFRARDEISAWREATPADALEYMVVLKRRGGIAGEKAADATVSQRFHILSSIYTFLQDYGVVDRNVFRAVRGAVMSNRREQVRPTKLIPFPTVEKILALPDRSTREGLRDLAILSLFFGCGLRRSEVRGLDVSDVEIGPTGEVTLKLRRTKAGKLQALIPPRWASDNVILYIQTCLNGREGRSGALFPSTLLETRGTERISTETLYRLFKRYCSRVGVKAAPHAARATACTALKSMGFEDRAVAGFLRHSTTSQVQTYDKRVNLERCGVALDYSAMPSQIGWQKK